MKTPTMIVYKKEGRTWIEKNMITDPAIIYEALAAKLRAKYSSKAPYIRRIEDAPDYETGGRTIKVYEDNGYMVKFLAVL